MRTATTVELSTAGRDTVEFVVEAEKLGLDVCWVAEAWGADGPSALGYLAARTERMLLGSGVLQLGIRSPVAVAQIAITLSNLSCGRFLLGLGASGPQVIEGLHGVSFARPLARMRETVDIVRQAFAGGKISYSGNEFQIPRPGGEAVPMRLSTRPEHAIPIYLAALSPAMLRLTGQIADGWLGTSFVPEGAAGAYFAHLDSGLAAAGRTRADIDICQGAEVAFAKDQDQLRGMVAGRKKELAFSLGGMGSASTNYYNRAYSRQGWADVAAAVREHWQRGDRDRAVASITDEMVLATTLIGTEDMVRARLGVWRHAGVNTVRLYPAGGTLDAKLSTLGRAIELVREV
ncbi:F420-dependent methylene-tetrahydromethanopterin reductase [Mycobacterium persicum]|uniref:Coenzyme F420-dependent oxidoreductase n=1 Tax=Mycobacterium persicum TaxID=1487726 RepID=A0A8E2IRC4_9MYCO|nr:LLM class flavin-dependent oxidoreductase [Mycobacterium persicum]KZS83142.1 F420-dependent methylene-tetrahydromethanopterin reductase [Mycobacterium persicum]ORB95782.1 F420-dependent methylene-tetrahydromethanopterin reductase [Mycobacterium persicum]ORC07757.1 F420-dependent methylene-tetrahydromethanopterin reductase [Mycobacterium persicum]VAZ70605.1 Putative coenzyme F420-dependent oxidoreductase [Mycobacterium persicum]VAZ86810.1 Putative coenzyme F420-dependent oxidoreductase [Myco